MRLERGHNVAITSCSVGAKLQTGVFFYLVEFKYSAIFFLKIGAETRNNSLAGLV
jgi:hypothetical protein